MAARSTPALGTAALSLALLANPVPAAAQGIQSVSVRGGFTLGAPASIYDNWVTIDRRRVSPDGNRDPKVRTETRYTERMEFPRVLFGEVWLGLSPALHAGLRGSLGSSRTTTRFFGGGGAEEQFQRDVSWRGADLLLRMDVIQRAGFVLSALGGGGVSWWDLNTGGRGRDTWLTLASPNLDFEGTTEWDDRSWNTVSGALGLGASYRFGGGLALNAALEQRFLRAATGAFEAADRDDIREEVGHIPTITYDSYVSYPTSLSLGVSWRVGGWSAPASPTRFDTGPPSPPGASTAPPPAGPPDSGPVLISPASDSGAPPTAFRAVGAVPHQVTRFRGPDRGTHVLEIHGRAPLGALELSAADTLVRGLFLYGPDPQPLVSRVERAPAEDGGLSYRIVLPQGRYRYSLEAATPALDTAAFSRLEATLGERTLGRVQVSDLLLGSSVTTFGRVPRSYREVVTEPLRCLAAPAGGLIVLLAEGYDLTARDGLLRYRVRVETDRSVEAFEIPIDEGLSGVSALPRSGRLTYERTVEAGAGRVAEVVRVRLPADAGGHRTLSLRIEDATDGSGATASRTLRIGGC